MTIKEKLLSTVSLEECFQVLLEERVIDQDEIFKPSMCERCKAERGSEKCVSPYGCFIKYDAFADFLQQDFENFNFKDFLDKYQDEINQQWEDKRQWDEKKKARTVSWVKAFNSRIKAINEAKKNGTYKAEDFPPIEPYV